MSGTSLLQSIREGASFVARQPLLRAIALCAVAWNSGFFALTAVLAPFALERLTMGVPDIGRAWAVYGAGLLLGAACAPAMIARLHVGFMMCFGPLVSAIGMLGMVAPAAHRGAMAAYVALFCLGFGPMTWLVLQTSVRQLVTPQALLGRVGAVITTAIYGVRPLGALAASATAALAGADYAIWLAMGLFCLSALAVLLSPATRLGRLDRDLSRADR
ncbi:MAG: MFS transporter [Alphaproteobacteria bacterium]|nr:MFS transporter [Alphaproteobacteria bacterium]